VQAVWRREVEGHVGAGALLPDVYEAPKLALREAIAVATHEESTAWRSWSIRTRT
jgi:hypothetical protein